MPLPWHTEPLHKGLGFKRWDQETAEQAQKHSTGPQGLSETLALPAPAWTECDGPRGQLQAWHRFRWRGQVWFLDPVLPGPWGSCLFLLLPIFMLAKNIFSKGLLPPPSGLLELMGCFRVQLGFPGQEKDKNSYIRSSQLQDPHSATATECILSLLILSMYL